MYKVAVILLNVVQYIGEYEEMPQVAAPLMVIDISEYEGVVESGYIYDSTDGTFSEPEPTEPNPEESETPEDPEVPEPEIPESITQPTLEEMQMQTLLNTEYLVVISELSNL